MQIIGSLALAAHRRALARQRLCLYLPQPQPLFLFLPQEPRPRAPPLAHSGLLRPAALAPAPSNTCRSALEAEFLTYLKSLPALFLFPDHVCINRLTA